MNSNSHNPMASAANVHSGEETLRLIASLPAPQGLEGRVHEALRGASRNGRVLAWPKGAGSLDSLKNTWMRTAAAAAIVFVVVGGGWGVYSRVEQGHNGKVIPMPLRTPAPGGFSGAGAIRTPTTLPGVTVTAPAKNAAGQKKNAKVPSTPGHPAQQPAVASGSAK